MANTPPNLNPSQRAIVTRIKAIGRQKGATPKEIKAAIETGIVESNLSNPSGGDADSAGWRQERRSLYANPTNLDASISRFFDETRAVRGKYGRAGDLAAAVQRPAAQFRGRYQQHSGEAQALLGGAGGTGVAPGSSRSTTRTVTTTTPGVDNSAARAQLIQSFLSSKGTRGTGDPVQFAMGIRDAQDVAPTTSSRTTRSSSRTPGAGATPKDGSFAKTHSGLKELFWQGQGGIDAKNGVKEPQGFVSGHTDHVHVAAGPKTVVDLARLAQSMGLHVGENPHFGGVHPVHVKGSFHYKGEAIDVSGPPEKMRAFAHKVASLYGIK